MKADNVEQLILVDKNDRQIGISEKLEAHKKALCHRAFSIFIFRRGHKEFELLLQQRNPEKYHCGGLWTNTCCGHPRPHETVLEAGQRRLHEEMGLDIPLQSVGIFYYQAEFDNGLTEHEVDHVLLGFYQEELIKGNATEISDYEWQSIPNLKDCLHNRPEKYTPWLAGTLSIAENFLRNNL